MEMTRRKTNDEMFKELNNRLIFVEEKQIRFDETIGATKHTLKICAGIIVFILAMRGLFGLFMGF